jgi:pyruvate formate lyase activating enzyme
MMVAADIPGALARSLGQISHQEPGEDELWKWSKEAMHYIQTPRGIKCKLCPQACDIAEEETGDCHTRVNVKGKLYSIAYGNPCAVNVDPIEKKPLYHFFPSSTAFSIATAGCNLACLNCQNWSISQASPRDTRNYDLMPEDAVRDCKSYNCKSIAYTYTDPVAFYEYAFDTARIARSQGIKNVFISAGYINEQPLREICQVLDAANIDLKSFSDEIYEMLNAGTLEPVLNSLKIFHEEGVWLEITNLLVPEWTDDFDMIRKMCDWLYDNDLYDYPLHFSRFHPQYKLTKLPPTPYEILEKARNIALEAGMNHVYIGNVPGTEAENTFCPACKKLVIERKGYRIVTDNLKNGHCGNCGEKIAGVWE